VPLTPGISPMTRLLRVNWLASVRRGAGGLPLVSPSFVAESGARVRVLDLRPDDALNGPAGGIPGAWRLTPGDAPRVKEWIGAEEPVVLVSEDGELASVTARYLEALGMRFVAAMEGGMQAWRTLGYATSRDPELLTRHLGPDTPPVADPQAPGDHLTLDAVRAHLGDTGAIRWIRLAAFLVHGKRSCVDGRDDHGVVGTPGGDAGEFVLAVAALEKVTGESVSDAALDQLLREWVDTFGRFYMHTDDHALDRLIDSLRQDDIIGPAVASLEHPNAWRSFLAKPPPAVHDALIEQLIDPQHVGCGHLKLILQNPQEYGVRPSLTPAFLRAWFRLRWEGAEDLEYVVLAGGHAEGGVLQVTVDDDDMWAYAPIPLISPFQHDTQLFVNHPQVVDFMRQHTAEFLSRAAPRAGLPTPDESDLLDAIRELAGQQLGETLVRLANGLPIYEARFDGTKVQVQAQGAVGAGS